MYSTVAAQLSYYYIHTFYVVLQYSVPDAVCHTVPTRLNQSSVQCTPGSWVQYDMLATSYLHFTSTGHVVGCT